jgi:Tol biopolymer transport system component
MTTEELERHLKRALREKLDREHGPDPTWAESPAARRAAELDRSRPRWPLRALAVAAMIGAGAAAGLIAGALNPTREIANGWVAFTVDQPDPAGGGSDTDIWFAALDREPRRVVGTEGDGVDQICPAFSPDGRSLAYGSVEANDAAGYRAAGFVVADVADDGAVTDRLSIKVGDGVPPPCPVWSPDGRQLAFGVPLTSPINPTRSGAGSEVWVVRLSDRKVTVLPDLLATDLEWSPDSSLLAIVGGPETAAGEGVRNGLQDARIHLYTASSGTMQTVVDTLGARSMTWSPDGERIAYAGGSPMDDSRHSLLVSNLDTGRQETLTDMFPAVHGIGPVWSPDGKTIAYQRVIAGSSEKHEVVLVTPDDRSALGGLANEVVMPQERTLASGARVTLWPWRVTWSPDGSYLLYVAWSSPNASSEPTSVVAVPTDPGAPAVIIAQVDGILSYDSHDTMRVQFQTWGQLPAN